MFFALRSSFVTFGSIRNIDHILNRTSIKATIDFDA